MPRARAVVPCNSLPFSSGSGLARVCPETIDRFSEFAAPWPRVANPDNAARSWISCVDTAADEALAFAARDRYLASDEVSRGIVMDLARWIMEQKSAKWAGKWPAPAKQNGARPRRLEAAPASEQEKSRGPPLDCFQRPRPGSARRCQTEARMNRPPLPPSCALCRPYEGRYRNYGTEDVPRMGRCDCARGQALAMGAKWGRKPKQKKIQFDGKEAAQGGNQ